MSRVKPFPHSLGTLHELLRYEPETGEFYWRKRMSPFHRFNPGDKVKGCFDSQGYRKIGILGKVHSYHRVAWMMVVGQDIPEGRTLDHIDRNPGNNRWANLRIATFSGNGCNRSPDRLRNVIRHPGVQNLQVRIQVNRKKIHIGMFATEEEAIRAAQEARLLHHGAFAFDAPDGFEWPEGM